MTDVVVVGVDGSADSSAALHWALVFAGERGAAVRLVHVWTPVPWYEELSSSGGAHAEARDHSAEEAADRTVRALGELTSMPANVEAQIVAGPPGEALVAAGRDALLLVVGASGRGGPVALRADRIGATARYVSRYATCPVTVIGLGRAPVAPGVLHTALHSAPAENRSGQRARPAGRLAQPA